MFKKILTILFSLAIVLSLFSCKKKEEATETLDFCASMAAQGEDLNLVGCFIEEPFENSKEVLLYLPDFNGLGWNRVTTRSIYADKDKINPAYLGSVLSVAIFDDPSVISIEYNAPGNFTSSTLNSQIVEIFSKKYEPDKLPNGEDDKFGIDQILATCISDTIYTNLLEIDKVKLFIPNLSDVTPIRDNIVIDPETLNPYFFGSENSWIGSTSFSNFLEQLKNNGVNIEDYPESDRLYIINSFVYDVMSAYRRDEIESETQSQTSTGNTPSPYDYIDYEEDYDSGGGDPYYVQNP